LRANRDLFKLRDPDSELKYLEQSVDGRGDRHEIFQQMADGVPVWGGRINVHFDRSGTLYALNARYAPVSAPTGAWRLDAKTAIARALADLALQGPIEDFTPETRALLDYPGPLAEKNVWTGEEGSAPQRAWRVEIRPDFCHLWRYFIDAATGAILEKYDAAPSDGPKTASANDLFGTARTINTYQVGSTYYLIDGTRKSFDARTGLPNSPKGALWTTTAGNTDLARVSQLTSANNTWTDATSISAHYNMAKVYDYYLGTHNRNGIDGAGGTMIAAVHVTEGGRAMDNAYWNGRLMAYGDGSRVFKPLARALDVAGHEMTHGVISATINLDYKNQSGALNESFADVFGCMIDRDDWKMGEDVIALTSAYPSGALRDMADPHNGGTGRTNASWQPAHMVEYVKLTLSDDNGGVHINNGIPNRACYLIAQALGREKTEKIYYRVMDARYLNPGAQFLDMRLAAVRAATDLYGADSPEIASVKDAFTQVGIGTASTNDIPTPRPADRAPLSGTQYIVTVGAKPGDSSLYLSKPVLADTAVSHLTSTQVYSGSGRPVAVSADGSLILFVDANHALRSIDGTGEKVVSASPEWKSVALSPDGSKAAVTTFQPDGKIHILDLAHPDQSRVIALYTPTTGQSAQSNSVVYADAVEFNPAGDNIIYDALNRVPQSQGNPIEFWDANILELQSGVITPFLPTLPAGVNLGNPSFAQTNDLNVAFDLIDEFTGTFSVVAADLFTGSFKVVDSGSVVPGGPRYSTRDDKLIFTRATGTGTALSIYQIAMAKDKITPAGKAVSYMANAQKPIWFARGPRSTGFRLPRAEVPDAFGLSEAAGGELSLELPSSGAIKGRRRADLAEGRRSAGRHRLAWGTRADRGIFLVRAEFRPDSGPARSLLLKTVR
jgi:Zn-dependent metalloprotease